MRAVSIVLLSALTVVSCSADLPTVPRSLTKEAPSFQEADSDSDSDRRRHRFEGTCEGAFAPPPFPPPPVYQQVDRGTCQMKGLGLMQVVSEQEIDVVSGTQRGRRTLTARNGDRLYALHVGTSRPVAPGRIGFQATMTIVGGTGRFAGATGEARAAGEANLMTRTSSYTIFDGWIVYGDSDEDSDSD